MRQLTDKQVLDKVVELGTENPDVRYDNDGDCAYTYGPAINTKTNRVFGYGCIVGQAILSLDPSEDTLNVLAEKEHDTVRDLGGIAFTVTDPNVVSTLQAIQENQDAGDAWGEAIGDWE